MILVIFHKSDTTIFISNSFQTQCELAYIMYILRVNHTYDDDACRKGDFPSEEENPNDLQYPGCLPRRRGNNPMTGKTRENQGGSHWLIINLAHIFSQFPIF